MTRRAGGGNSGETRARLITTAEKLFAERGLDAVSLAEINRVSGQRNATALHYHFGGRDGLLQAIFDKHTPRVNALRGQLLQELPETASLAQMMRVLVVPLAEQVGDPDGGCHYLMFMAQVVNHPGLQASELDQRSEPVLDEQRRRFEAAVAHIPEENRGLRLQFSLTLVFNALAEYARSVRDGGFDRQHHGQFVEQLTAAATGALEWSSEQA